MKIRSTSLVLAAALATATAGFFVGAAWADQPHMEAALDALRTAHSELDMARANKGGHRERAMRLIDDAIAEVKLGMEYAD
ncbi:MAG TPA: hypothetical protein VMJ73_07965 [Rhizomicrobium sp.]|nr:hypothetical protein [Rhizomicrobium sp.]